MQKTWSSQVNKNFNEAALNYNESASIQKSTKQLWDINDGLPKWSTKPNLLASSFVLHWLNNPQKQLKEWFNSLSLDGWIALAIPIKGSFPEWYEAAEKANLTCTALDLASHH